MAPSPSVPETSTPAPSPSLSVPTLSDEPTVAPTPTFKQYIARLKEYLDEVEETRGKANKVVVVFTMLNYMVSYPDILNDEDHFASTRRLITTTLRKLDEFEQEYDDMRWQVYRQRVLDIQRLGEINHRLGEVNH